MNRINDEFRMDSRKSPQQLEREIDTTRAELLATLEELEHRLSPTDLFNQFWSQLRRHGGEFGGNLGQSLKDNPMPALLTSIGIAWMMASNGRHHDGASMYGAQRHNGNGGSRMRHAGERVREKMHGVRQRMHDVRDRVHGMGDSVRQRADGAREGVVSAGERVAGSGRHAREQMRGRAEMMASAARHRAYRARSGFGYLLEEQPLLLGAIGLAAGVIAGAALPPTEQEDRAFGRARDRALERAKQAGAEKARRLREHAEEAAESTKSSLRDEDTGTTPEEHLTTQAGGSVQESPGTRTSSPGTGLTY